MCVCAMLSEILMNPTNERKCRFLPIEENLARLPRDNEVNGMIIDGKTFSYKRFCLDISI